ncbi:MAG: DUF6314 family protein [Rickettsiaceae bacterium]|nr:DUF6314 family protein [Rickettsiaceae bacterium]
MSVSYAQDIFSLLQGKWALSRYISHSTFAQDIYEGFGFAIISSESEYIIKYHEKLKLKNLSSLSSSSLEIDGERAYHYIYHHDQDQITKYFIDGSLFYDIKILHSECTGSYFCERDIYKAKYCFENNHSFLLKYEVSGLKKDYVIGTRYTRIY